MEVYTTNNTAQQINFFFPFSICKYVCNFQDPLISQNQPKDTKRCMNLALCALRFLTSFYLQSFITLTAKQNDFFNKKIVVCHRFIVSLEQNESFYLKFQQFPPRNCVTTWVSFSYKCNALALHLQVFYLSILLIN